MIKVVIERDANDRRIRGFQVYGHANFADAGQDIVCAGVSAVTVGTVNAIGKLLDVETVDEVKEGLLRVKVPVLPPQSDTEIKVQLLLESMVVMLTSIQQSYGQYMKIEQPYKS